MMERVWDAIVIGGGPAGSTFATTMAHCGRRILVLEKEVFPRYHIGESLLPANWRVLDAIGIGEQVRNAPFVHKAGGTFIWGQDREPWTVHFGEVNDLPAARQVKREEFDRMLLDHAAQEGAEVRQGCNVLEVLFEHERAVGVRYKDQQGHEQVERAHWVADASGQNKLLARRFNLVEYHPAFRNAALWSYWENGKRLTGKDAGNVLYVSHEYGWFWYIPLDNRTNLISVGTIVRPSGKDQLKKKKLDEFYRDLIASCDAIPELLADARQVTAVRAITDYSYCCSQLSGPGWVLIGDSACFVDPILSSGVQLATYHGLFAALTLNTILQEPAWEADALAFYEQQYKLQYNDFVQLCLNMYDTNKASKEDYFSGARQMVQSEMLAEALTGGQKEAVDGRSSFIGLISGLPAQEALESQMKLFALRQKAAAYSHERVTFTSEESLKLVIALAVHKARLQEGKTQRDIRDLNEDTPLRLPANTTFGERFFLPVALTEKQLQRSQAVENSFGDRFQPTKELALLLDLLSIERPYREIRQRFFAAFQLEPETQQKEAFRDWIELLAGYGLVEWT